MAIPRSASLLQRAVELELAFCLRVTHKCNIYVVQRFFAIISRLGDGVLWYSLMLCLPFVDGWNGLQIALLMVAVGTVNLMLYKVLKRKTSRERPYAANRDIHLGTRPLDQYSFPSGHTLHAVSFSLILIFFYPALTWILIPFTLLVAMSRVILGLHYPTDVLAGATIGLLTAIAGITLF